MNLLSSRMWEFIVIDIVTELKYLPAAFAVGLMTGALIWIFSRRKKKAFIRVMMIAYLTMVFIITLFEREPGSRAGVSLVLLETLGGPRANAYVMENILLFLPFGFLAPRMWKCMGRLPACMAGGFCFSLGIETIQLFTGRGHFQVDDLLTNTMGAGIGAIMVLIRLRRRE